MSAPADQPFPLGNTSCLNWLVVNEPLQVVGKCGHSRVSVCGVTFNGLLNDHLQIRRYFRVRLRQGNDRGVHDLVEQSIAMTLIKRRPKRQQFIESQAQRIDFAASIVWPLNVSGAMYLSVPKYIARLSQVSFILRRAMSEVRDPYGALDVKHQIGRLDCPMKNSLSMSVFERSADLYAYLCDALPVRWSLRYFDVPVAVDPGSATDEFDCPRRSESRDVADD